VLRIARFRCHEAVVLGRKVKETPCSNKLRFVVLPVVTNNSKFLGDYYHTTQPKYQQYETPNTRLIEAIMKLAGYVARVAESWYTYISVGLSKGKLFHSETRLN
jgi:hypothetical protein